MHGYQKICLGVYWLALVAWAAGLTTAAIAAMHSFTRLPKMELTLGNFAAYPVDEHGTIAAGMVMADVFFTVDLIQIVAAPLVLITLLLQLTLFRMPIRRPANLLRLACVLAAGALFGMYAITIAPRMNTNLRQYWAAAQQGDIDAAHALQAEFQGDHKSAERILGIDLLLVLTAIAGSAAALVSTPRPSDNTLEAPALLTARR